VIFVPIGRFSKITRLSVKALPLYDEIGLLPPARVDPSSGYRYYDLGQANRAEAVRILRSVDMPLDEIRAILDTDDPQLVHKQLVAELLTRVEFPISIEAD
jgi:DNA-binding transcriptional MerR regulator